MLVDFGLAVSPGHLSLGGTRATWRPRPLRANPWISVPMCTAAVSCWPNCSPARRLFTTASSLALTREQAAAAPQLDGIRRPVAAVLSAGLHPRPDDRPADSEMLLAQLESAIEETHGRRWLAAAGLGAIGSTAATVAAGTALTGATATAGTGTTVAAGAKAGTSKLSRGKVIGAAAAGAAIIAVAAFTLLRPASPQPTAAQTPTPPAAATAATPQGNQIGDHRHLPDSLAFSVGQLRSRVSGD